jgi:hypothetical protein
MFSGVETCGEDLSQQLNTSANVLIRQLMQNLIDQRKLLEATVQTIYRTTQQQQ